MDESLTTLLGILILGVVLLSAGGVGWMVLSRRKPNPQLDALVADLTPRALVEAPVAPGSSAELRTVAVPGALKVWLDYDINSPTGRWSATATVGYRISAPGGGYRDAGSEGAPLTEARVVFEEDGEGFATLSPIARTGALRIPQGTNHDWLQLLTLPSCPEGSELFVRVAIVDLKTADRATFRAFIGLSAA